MSETLPQKKVLMIVANPATSPVTGWPVGFWWAELSHPYWVFSEAGYEIEIVSPAGGDLVADTLSDPKDESGYASDDLISLGFKTSKKHAPLLLGTKSLGEIDPRAYDAIFVAGGQSPMITMIDDTKLHASIASVYEAGKIVALVCHGTCNLLKVRLSNGEFLAKGKTWTGFANSEEAYVDTWVGQKVQPFWIEEEAKKMEDTNFITSAMFKPFAVRDGALITGQQQASGAAAAELVVDALGH
ncbi:MAG: type 1 glutamine amidotransferase domain-containing protein [Pseudomonadota bacterium]